MVRVLGSSESWRLPGHELSGLALRHGARGNDELLAVSDSSFRVFRGAIGQDASTGRSIKLDDAVAGHTDGDGSQWEGVATDRSGRIFVLEEHPGHVFVFNAAPDRLISAFSLEVPDTGAEWERRWGEDDNARGETLVLRTGGCILVIKQKDPVVLVEFGPPGNDEAVSTFLADGHDFELPDTAELKPRRKWLLDDAAAERVKSISDAAVLDDRLYVLSAKSRCIAELQALTEEGGTVGLKGGPWAVPGDIDQPEGLVILSSSRRPVVTSDVKRDDRRDNTFLLDPLPS